MWLGKGGWLQVRELDRQLAAQRDANAKLKLRNDALDADVRDLKTGYEAIEERARSELGMVKQDEVFFQLRQRPEQAAGRASGCRRRRRAARRRCRSAPETAPRKSASGRRIRRDAATRSRTFPRDRSSCDTSLRVTIRACPRPPRFIASSRERRKSGKCVLEGAACDRDLRGAPRRARDADRHRKRARTTRRAGARRPLRATNAASCRNRCSPRRPRCRRASD